MRMVPRGKRRAHEKHQPRYIEATELLGPPTSKPVVSPGGLFLLFRRSPALGELPHPIHPMDRPPVLRPIRQGPLASTPPFNDVWLLTHVLASLPYRRLNRAEQANKLHIFVVGWTT